MTLRGEIGEDGQGRTNPIRQPMLVAGTLIGVAGIGLQFHFMMQVPELSTTEAVARFFSYFTILTNLLVLMGYAFPLLAPGSSIGKFFSRAPMRGATLVYIVMVGVVYSLLLRNLYHPAGWAKAADVLVHDAAPVYYAVFWFLCAEKSGLRPSHAAQWLLYPLAYIVYTLLRGVVTDWYPYPFVDVRVLGYSRTFIHAGVLALVFLIAGLGVVAAARWLSARRAAAEQAGA
ncbi:MAG TPA: Pr6Pr family membrane protein [Pseudacidobacterium sp.]|nr:Pr6Pr family membrane protein [Pseudacidobacterium sp.]